MVVVQEKDLIDENIVDKCCTTLESFLDGRVGTEECLQAIADLEYRYRFASEKISRLKRLFQQKRIDDVGRWRSEIRANIWAIKNLASIQNHLGRERINEQKIFRVEMNDPIDCYRSPLIFRASVYVNDTYSQTINCIVTDDELAR